MRAPGKPREVTQVTQATQATQVVRQPRRSLVPLLLAVLLLAAFAAGLALYSQDSAPEATLRPVRAANPEVVERSQVEAAFGVKRSGRKRAVEEGPPDLPPAPAAEVEAPRPRPASRARAKALNARGLSAYRRGLHDDALALYSRALAADPTYHWAHYNAACMVAIKGDVEAAIVHLKAWAQHAPEPPDIKARVTKDADFDAVRDDPRWASWLSRL